MKTKLLLSLILLSCTLQIFAQDPNWEYLRRENTGIGGSLHYVVQGDAFGNIWTGGYESSSEGSLVRIATDTIYTNWSTYSEEYLPNGLIYDIAFDSTGIIWVGSEAGITTSGDGLIWTHYNMSNTPFLTPVVESVAIGAGNSVWTVNTNSDPSLGGVGYFDGTVWNYFTSNTSGLPAGAELRDIAVDANDVKWIAFDIGLISFDGTNWQHYTSANSGLSDDNVWEVAIDNQNRVWALVGNAVDIFDGSAWTQINESDWPISGVQARSLALHGDQVIIAEGNGSRVLLFDGSTWTSEYMSLNIYDSYIDANGTYWISGYGVVAKNDGTGWIRYTQNNTGLPTNFNDDIFIDSQGRRWFANGNGGIQVFDCPNWEVYGPDNGGLFPNPQPLYQTTIGTSITEDADGDIWFTYDGTSGYAIQIPDGNYKDYASWIIWHIENSHPSFQSAEEVVATSTDKVFIRIYNGSVFMYDKTANSWTRWANGNGLTGNATALGRGPDGKMYVGHYQGLDVYDNGTWTAIDLAPQGIEHVNCIKFDANDNMWLGSSTSGLYRFDGTTWTNWNESNSNIAANYVTAIDFDTANNIYISAHNTFNFPYYGGFSYFDGTGNTFTTFMDGSSPLAHKQVEDIAVDSFGNIWTLTQSEGFSIYNPNGIDGFDCIDRTLERTLSVSDLVFDSNMDGLSYPNPFKESTTVLFYAEVANPVSVEVFDILGRSVKAFKVDEISIGKNSFNLNLSQQAPGIYFCKLSSNNYSRTIKLIKG
ncbi:two-component regulator propeller domain-containing protein [Aequorivita sp. SDUM287046]|uniref:Two-component regulator propeller domain-containing protein n=1 Tax=Aequorivita aurantiaca TaxID=3053356 RepID=A0ABT8DGB7_9FLAO|nr:two-component regulator propeller domain-containing protein [Aequorivita aurantiaca]MDN3722890.1 two-component regulator propeller domain-containing protein [Aequorivita aurantiaca]